jgi:hypothetical protein
MTKPKAPTIDLRKKPLIPAAPLALGINVTEPAVRRAMRDLNITLFRQTAHTRGLLTMEQAEQIYRHLSPALPPA